MSGAAPPAADAPRLKRHLIVEELVATEESYVACLNCMVALYLGPLRASGALLAAAEIDLLFRNVEVLCALHNKLLADLKRRQAAAAAQLADVRVADVILNFAPFFKVVLPLVRVYSRTRLNWRVPTGVCSVCEQARRRF